MPRRSEVEVGADVAARLGHSGPVEWRAWRWAITLPDGCIAFAADDDDGWTRLRRESALLGRLAREAPFAVPAIIVEDDARRLQVRRMVPGISGDAVERLVFGRDVKEAPGRRYQADLPLTDKGRRFAGDIGRALFGLQASVTAAEAAALGFPAGPYLPILDAIDAELARHDQLGDLRAVVTPLRRWFAALPDDQALCLRDLQLHNVAVDPRDGALAGLFDFDDAAVAHRLEDFKYLPSFGLAFTGIALDAYAAAGGRPIELADVGRFHVLSALEHFLFVAHDSPRWPAIIEWTRAAVTCFAPSW